MKAREGAAVHDRNSANTKCGHQAGRNGPANRPVNMKAREGAAVHDRNSANTKCGHQAGRNRPAKRPVNMKAREGAAVHDRNSANTKVRPIKQVETAAPSRATPAQD